MSPLIPRQDEALHKAHAETQDWYQRAFEDLNTKRYREISRLMKIKTNRAKYSRRACRDRFDTLHAGVAVVPFEQDPNPIARRAEVLQRMNLRRQARQAEADAIQREADLKLEAKENEERIKAEAKRKAEQAKTDKAAQAKAVRRQREAEKAARVLAKKKEDQKKAAAIIEKQREKEDKEQQAKVDKEAARHRSKAEKDKATYQAKIERANMAIEREHARIQKIKTNEAALEIVKKGMRAAIAANSLPHRVVKKTRVRASRKASAKSAAVKKSPATRKGKGKAVTEVKKDPGNNDSSSELDDDEEVTTSNLKPSSAASSSSASANTADTSTPTKPANSTPTKPTNTTTSSPNTPRTSMTVPALRSCCRARHLRVVGKKADLLKSLMDDDEGKTAAELKELCEGRKITTSGTKKELMERIARDDAGMVLD